MKKEGSSGGTQPVEEQQQLTELGGSTVKTGCGTIQTLTIIGQIEGHQEAPEGAKTTKYEHVLPLLAAVEESDEVDGVLFLLNTLFGMFGVVWSQATADVLTVLLSLFVSKSEDVPQMVCWPGRERNNLLFGKAPSPLRH